MDVLTALCSIVYWLYGVMVPLFFSVHSIYVKQTKISQYYLIALPMIMTIVAVDPFVSPIAALAGASNIWTLGRTAAIVIVSTPTLNPLIEKGFWDHSEK